MSDMVIAALILNLHASYSFERGDVITGRAAHGACFILLGIAVSNILLDVFL